MPVFDDSDMKIVPDDPSEVFDTGEGAANSFAREKATGNMEKAKCLGQDFAAEITAGEKGIVWFGCGEYDDELTIAQRQVMFAYIINKVIEDMAPNSIVAQSALSSFYETVQSALPEVYERITDSAAFSMYILSDRAAPDDPCAIGRVFARLCGHGKEALFERYGCELAEYFTMYCTQLLLRIHLIR